MVFIFWKYIVLGCILSSTVVLCVIFLKYIVYLVFWSILSICICIIDYGDPLEINEQYVCKPQNHWSGMSYNLEDLDKIPKIPSSIHVSIGGFECTQEIIQQNMCQLYPSRCT